jgi:hypothetical protein
LEGRGQTSYSIFLIEELSARGMTKEDNTKLGKHLQNEDNDEIKSPPSLSSVKTYIFLDDFQAGFKSIVHHDLSLQTSQDNTARAKSSFKEGWVGDELLGTAMFTDGSTYLDDGK